MFELTGITKSYDGKVVVAPCDLSIAPGRTTALIGPSGSGKSTLLRIMVGLVRADAGTIRLDGALLSSETAPALRLRMGYVIQEGGLFPHLTARDNVILMARHLGWERERIRRRVDEIAELVRLSSDLLDRFPVQISGGQRQRVGLMRALMLDPDVLLLDEPLGALDPMIRFDLQSDLKRVFAAVGKTVVLVTHDMGEAGFLADEVVLLNDGRIVQRGAFEELVLSPADDFVARFVRAQRTAADLLHPDPE